MRILFGSAHPYLPQMTGGAQLSTDALAHRIAARGHAVAVLGGLTGDGWLGLASRIRLKLSRRGYVRDRAQGYPVYRAWFAVDAVAAVTRAFRADVAVFQSRLPVALAQAVDRSAVRTFVYLRNVEHQDLGGRPGVLDRTGFIANSRFTADRFAQTDGVRAAVIHPMIDPDRYRVEPARCNVTFINPHPDKGVSVALAVAERCPDIPFRFQRAWGLTEPEEAALRERVAALPNVTLHPRTDDMRAVYRDAAIVLAPSLWEEAFGRVAAEPQVSGIPVIGSDRGGLPEAIGPGGIVVPWQAPIDDWVTALRSLWDDTEAWRRASEAAKRHAARPEMDADRQVDRLLAILAAPVGAPPAEPEA